MKNFDWERIVFVFLSAVFCVCSILSHSQHCCAIERPNFIVIFCDNLGYGDIEPFGSEVHRTPNLNRMAAEGRRFTHFCVTAGVCTPSRASLITGCYSQRIGMHDNPRDGQVLRPISPYGLNPNETTIAEVLREAGYLTGMIGKWHLGDQPKFLPTQHGFDWFLGIPYSDDMTAEVGRRLGDRFDGTRWPELPLVQNGSVVEAPVNRDLLTLRYTQLATLYIREKKDKPFFLYLSQAMPGSTRTPFAGPNFKGKSNNGAWGDSIEELDWSTGQILDELKKQGISEKTLVIWTSDNGAPLSRKPNDPSRGSNGILHGRGYTTGEGAFRVPTIFWWPSKIPAGTTCDQLATTMDLLPTFAKLANASPSDQHNVDGKNILPLLMNEPDAKSPYDVFYYYERDQLQAVRSGEWKLFLPLQSFQKHPHFRANQEATALLFHLYDDPSCKKNLAAEHPDVVRRLTELSKQAIKDLGDRGVAGSGQRQPGRVDQPKPLILGSEL